MSRENGGVVGPNLTPSPDSISGVWGLVDTFELTQTTQWPGAPRKPTSITSAGVFEGQTISFVFEDGGSPPTSIIVTATPGGATASGLSSPLTVTGLTPGVEYTFTVELTNILGTTISDPSDPFMTPFTPENTVLPIISGVAQVGNTLTISTGTWTGFPSPTYTYQWQRGTTDIAGATNSSYVVTSSDENNTLRCIVTATNVAGFASATSADTASVPGVPPSVSYLVVAGGGGGLRGGGGAGGFRTGSSFAITPGTEYLITVGAGAAQGRNPGAVSSFGAAPSVIQSAGGGGGGSGPSGSIMNGVAGGSGGGGGSGAAQSARGAGGAGNVPAVSPSQGAAGGSGQGSMGGCPRSNGGGGGAMGGGGNRANNKTAGGGEGGPGQLSSISGVATTYAGGGGGSSGDWAGGPGGAGGGGNGGQYCGNIVDSTSGLANTGGGGGGLGGPLGTGNGGSGIVIISYPSQFKLPSSITGAYTYSLTGGNRVYRFTGSGSITW